jgi:hypothetical protein
MKKQLTSAPWRSGGGAAPVGAAPAIPLFPSKFTADPAALVDKGRVYLYVGTTSAPPEGKDYVMNEWLVYSSCDMKNWTDHGSPLRYDVSSGPADAWASDITSSATANTTSIRPSNMRPFRARRSAWPCRTARPARSSTRSARR